jgi:hypothetical protein
MIAAAITRAQPIDLLIIEGLANPKLRPWANDIMDIVTAHSKKEITGLEADFLLWSIEDTRAPSTVTDPETLALIKRLTAQARTKIGSQNEPRS